MTTINAFLTLNIYIDRAMELLTDGEFRVLIFSCRHILGWQDRIDNRCASISLTMFENGFTSAKTNTRFAGCGLKRAAIIKAIKGLVEFGFLEREGLPTEKGQAYKLCEEIAWDKLEARLADKQALNTKKTAKATKVRVDGTSDVPVTSHVTMQGNVARYSPSNVARTQTNALSNTRSNAVGSRRNSTKAKDWSNEDALITAWVDATDRFGTFNDGYRRKLATKLLALNCTVDMVVAIVKWKRPNGNTMSYEFHYLLDDLPEYLVIKARADKEAERKAAAKAKMDETIRINQAMDEQAGVKYAS